MTMGGGAIGAQIRGLREAVGCERSALAEALGVDPAEMAEMERGRRDVRAEDVAAAAEFLGVSQLAILQPGSLLGRLAVAARTNGHGEPDRGAVMRLTALAELNHVLTQGGHPPPLAPSRAAEAPEGKPGQSWLSRARDLAEWAVGQFGSDWRQGHPLPDLAEAIEDSMGVDVMVESLGGAGAPLGVSITDADFPFIMVNADQPTPRALFSLAHELGHVLSRDGYALRIDNHFRAPNDSERAANAFAASLLMPEDDVRRTVAQHGRTAESLARMLIDFGVSYESLIYRLHNLRLINANGRDRLKAVGWAGLINAVDDAGISKALLSARGTRPARRPPILLARRCLRGALDGTVSAAPLARLLNADIDEIIDKIDSIGPESAAAINENYSSPPDPDDVAHSALDDDPLAV